MLCRKGARILPQLELFHTSNKLPVFQHRLHSHSTAVAPEKQDAYHVEVPQPTTTTAAQPTGLERLPTKSILRNLFLGTLFTSPYLFKPGFSILQRIANSQSRLLNPDLNPVLYGIIKPLIYNAFCAGRTQREIFETRDEIKKIGYSGVILCYGKEAAAAEGEGRVVSGDAKIEAWKKGTLDTLDMVGDGDWLGVKLTGAGEKVTNALKRQEAPCPTFAAAMDAICEKAQARGCRLWIDAEKNSYQAGIDAWTIDMMRKYNTNGKALVYNTIQAYLKSSRQKLQQQLALAAEENWTMAVKLVRGAYIGTDPREIIHDTKRDTDESYDSIVRDILTGSNLGTFQGGFPKTELFLAGHNPDSVAAALDLVRTLDSKGQLKTVPDFGQLQGMADELGCSILQKCENAQRANASSGRTATVPRVYKCLTWGTVQECMQYLVRRAVENSAGTDRMRDGIAAYRAELKRRFLGRFGSTN